LGVGCRVRNGTCTRALGACSAAVARLSRYRARKTPAHKAALRRRSGRHGHSFLSHRPGLPRSGGAAAAGHRMPLWPRCSHGPSYVRLHLLVGHLCLLEAVIQGCPNVCRAAAVHRPLLLHQGPADGTAIDLAGRSKQRRVCTKQCQARLRATLARAQRGVSTPAMGACMGRAAGSTACPSFLSPGRPHPARGWAWYGTTADSCLLQCRPPARAVLPQDHVPPAILDAPSHAPSRPAPGRRAARRTLPRSWPP
jgi:hypothetical protein